MDPFTALGLAGNVLQFIEFTSMVINQVGEIRQHGNPASVVELDTVTRDFDVLARKLAAATTVGEPSCLSQDDQAIVDMSRDCASLATQLSASVSKVNGQPGQSTWRTLRQALRTIWTEKEMSALARRLSMIREQLQFRMTFMMKQNVDHLAATEGDRISDMKASETAILDSIADHSGITTARIYDTTIDLRSIMESSEARAAHRHEETISMIKQYRASPASFSRMPQNLLVLPELELHSPTTQYAAAIRSSLPFILRYERMLYRKEDIEEAHQDTYRWVLSNNWQVGREWSNFLKWLEEGEGCYWFNGKAGSGKSTLMKYIIESVGTERALHKWAGGHRRLIVASSYLWRAGTSHMQKNLTGLFRKLLLDVLNQCPELTETLFPEWTSAALKKVQAALRTIQQDPTEQTEKELAKFRYHFASFFDEPTTIDVRKAFKSLLNLETSDTRLCLFIDGLDELEGNIDDLLQLLMSKKMSSWVKIAVSSRPIPECEDALRHCPKLRLQDLTTADMHEYVAHKLDTHPRAKLIEASAMSELKRSIVEKSSGVFLWTVLVVKSLEDGMRNSDTIKTLMRRLDKYPSELDDLYEHMLQRMNPFYREQASQLLQIVMRANSRGDTLSSIELYWANVADPSTAITAPVHKFTSEEVEFYRDVIERRLRSRCCGLLEIDKRHHIAFLHRTVLDFLQQPEVWRRIVALNIDSRFDANESLLSSALYMIKGCSPFVREASASFYVGPRCEELLRHDDKSQFAALKKCLVYCRLAESSTGRAQEEYLESLDRTMRQYWDTTYNTGQAAETFVQQAGVANLRERSWTQDINPDLSDLLAVAVVFGMTLYVERFLAANQGIIAGVWGTDLLILALKEIVPELAIVKERFDGEDKEARLDRYLTVLRLLLEAGADPHSYRGFKSSPWDYALYLGPGMERGPRQRLESVFEENDLRQGGLEAQKPRSTDTQQDCPEPQKICSNGTVKPREKERSWLSRLLYGWA